MKKYRVYMHTSPSPASTYYEGYVDVLASSEEEAGNKAKRELTRKDGTFFDRSPSSFIIDKISVLH